METDIKEIKTFFSFLKVASKKNDGALNKLLLYLYSIQTQVTHKHIKENAGCAHNTLYKVLVRATNEGYILPAVRAHKHNNKTYRSKAYVLSHSGKQYVKELIESLGEANS